MAYDKDKDYQALIDQAVQNRDYISAAQYEQQRNEKIADMNAAGTNVYGATQTNNYSPWVDFAGSATNVGVYTMQQDYIRDQMNKNSIAWHGADESGKDMLHKQNEFLASLLGPNVIWDPSSGDWSGAASMPTSNRNGGGSVGGSWPSWDISSVGPKPTFDSKYQMSIDEMLDKILNREDFSYNAEEDDLYQQYKAQYNREGDRAMNDTLAAAASQAGGMNSYAVNAATQANNYYAAQLADKIPELYEMAYQMYLDDIDMQVRDLGLLTDMDATQYGRYRDTMSDWYNDRDFSYGVYRDDVSDHKWRTEFDYNAGRDAVADRQWDQNFGYNAWRDFIGDSRYESETAYDRVMDKLSAGIMPNATLLEQAGMTSEEASAYLSRLFGQENSAYESVGDNVDSGGRGTYDNGGLGEDTIKAMQDVLGVTPDGKWGETTTDAAGGLSAKEYYDQVFNAQTENPADNVTVQSIIAELNKYNEAMLEKESPGGGGTIGERLIASYVVARGLDERSARYLFEYFGYDPDEWVE